VKAGVFVRFDMRRIETVRIQTKHNA
jgi:hypothetical protein